MRQALGRVVEDGNRAADVIGRIRALIKKAPPRKERLEINRTIGEVIELTHGEAVKNGVLVRTELAAGVPLIHGDRVQLQRRPSWAAPKKSSAAPLPTAACVHTPS